MAQPSDFPLLWTDGDQNHVPTDKEKDSGYKSSDAYGLSQKALINFATEMQKQLGRKADGGCSEQTWRSVFKSKPPITATWKPLCAPDLRMLEVLSKFVESNLVTKMSIVGLKLFEPLEGNHSEFIFKTTSALLYTKIPNGYSAWPRQRKGSEKIDWYIFGHPRNKKFDSFAQFALHIYTLQFQPVPGNCKCKVCLKHPLTENDPIEEDPAPATMVTLTGDPVAAPPTSNVQTEAGPSKPRATQSSSQPFPTQFLEDETDYPSGSAPSGPAAKFQPNRRNRATVNYTEDYIVDDDDSDADVTSGDLDTEDEDPEPLEDGKQSALSAKAAGKQPQKRARSSKAAGKQPVKRARFSKGSTNAEVTRGHSDTEDDELESTEEREGRVKHGKKPALSAKAAGKQPAKRPRSSKAAGKRPEKRALSSSARGKQPTKLARIDNDEDPTDVDRAIGNTMNVDEEEKDSGAEDAQVVMSDGESFHDSDFPEFEDSVPDADVVYYQELFAKVKRLHIERLFTRLRMEKTQRLFGPMTQVLDTNFDAPETMLHKMITELPEQDSWVFRIGEIVCYIVDPSTEVHQARTKTDSKFYQVKPENREIIGRPPWRAGVITQVPDTKVNITTLGQKHGEELEDLHLSGYLIEPFPDFFCPEKDATVASLYVPTRHMYPFAYAIELHKGFLAREYHGSIYSAMERMCNFSLVYQQYIKGQWPGAILYFAGIYLGAELIVVGDAVRIRSEFLEKRCHEIMIVKSIKLKYNDLEPEEDGSVTGEKFGLRRLLFRGYGYTTDKDHINVGEEVPFSEEFTAHKAMRQQQKSVTWYRIGRSGQEMEVDFSRIIGRLFEAPVVMQWFSGLWDFNLEDEAINCGHASVVRMRTYARAKNMNLGFDPNDKSGKIPRWFWARDRVHALDLIHHDGKREPGEKATRGLPPPTPSYWADWHTPARDPLSWRTIRMNITADNAIPFPGKKVADQPRKFIGPYPYYEQPATFPPGRYYNITQREWFDDITTSNQSILTDKENRLARREVLQNWWNEIFFFFQYGVN